MCHNGTGFPPFQFLDLWVDSYKRFRDCCVQHTNRTISRKHHEPFLDTADEGQWTSPGEVEHKLEFTEVYNLFLRHFENKISGFIEEEAGGTVEQFQQECEEALQTLEEFSPRRFFIEILLATTDYDRFYFLMVGEAKKLRREKEHARRGNGDSLSGSSSSHK
ncbi:conserved unknown protein [Ectocarpus siliculosus]|uniref:BART domain-containing protein n=1 Tax=Ectocarpus siliculosus TaxID=2880 RepID=D8LHI3_ECTSI|nr:conserved unknown protein [Ectocarpus siliculosus]|eukprot:CBN79134.1 conserved unknown protein [Ectocarpus siliculosus]